MQFLCPNCNIISEVSKIETDEAKKARAKDIQKEIEVLESLVKKEEEKWSIRALDTRYLNMDILNWTVQKKECETKNKYIECPICKERHYVKFEE